MAYIGRSPTPGEVIVLNSIESQFNGVLTTFNLTRTTGGVTSDFYPVSSAHLFVSLGGVIQEPDPTGDTGFRINFNTIVFAVPPPAGTSCFIICYGNVVDIGAPADGTVSPIKLTSGGPSWDSSGNVTVSGNLTVNGSTTTINSTTLTIDDKNIVVADGQSTSAGIDTAGIDFGSTAIKLRYYDNSGTGSVLSFEGTNVGIGTTSSTNKLKVQGDLYVTADSTFASSGYLIIPTGNSAARPGSPSGGMIRYNSENQQFEGYTTAWGGFGGASGASGNAVFYENDTSVTASYTITSGKNAMTAGPITINNGVEVTVPTGSVWTVV